MERCYKKKEIRYNCGTEELLEIAKLISDIKEEKSDVYVVYNEKYLSIFDIDGLKNFAKDQQNRIDFTKANFDELPLIGLDLNIVDNCKKALKIKGYEVKRF